MAGRNATTLICWGRWRSLAKLTQVAISRCRFARAVFLSRCMFWKVFSWSRRHLGKMPV